MKKINLFLTILAAAAGFTNCSKAELVENKETEKGGSVVYATTDAATKTTLANDYKVLWSTGDKITFIKDGATNTTYTYTLSSGAGTTSGTFTCTQTPEDGTYTVWYNYDKNEVYWHSQNYVSATDISGAPMKATATVSDGIVSDISFKNEGGILRYTVKGNKTIKSIKVKSASSPYPDVTLDCGTSGVALTEGGTVFNIVVKPGTYSDVTLTFSATDFTLATKKASSFVVKKNTVSLATFEAADLLFLPAGALKGLFTVGIGADGKAGTADDVKVRFSQGNLKYDDTKWKFYDHQYDYLKGYEYSPVSLFPWGYDATKTISLGSNNCVKTHNKKGDKLVYDKASSGGGDDWGVAYCESNDITVGIWRTLSKEEWEYLIKTRTMTNGKARYSIPEYGFTIGSTAYNGLFLYPDNYNGDVVSNSMTWDDINAAGIVFLPAAGCYDIGYVTRDETEGFYWSSSAYSEYSSYLMYFQNTGNVTPDKGDDEYDDCKREKNYSVRLVTEVK